MGQIKVCKVYESFNLFSMRYKVAFSDSHRPFKSLAVFCSDIRYRNR